MIRDVQEWVSAILPNYKPFIGGWQDEPNTYGNFIFAVQQNNGPIRTGVRYDNYRVIVLGPRNAREHQLTVMADANALIAACMDGGIIPCGAASIRATMGPSGPALTTENRPWCSVPFEIIY